MNARHSFAPVTNACVTVALAVASTLLLVACAGAAVAQGTRPAGEAGQGASDGRRNSPVAIAWVYHDGRFLWSGDYSFNANALYTDNGGGPPDGRHDIKVTVTGPWGGFQPFARNWEFDLRPYACFTFALKPTVPEQTIRVYFEGSGDILAGTFVDALKYGPTPLVGQWSTYTIPLSELGIAGRHVAKFAIQDQTGLPNNVFYLADIGFLPAGCTKSGQDVVR